MENKKLTRSNDKMLAGVCAGLADYFGWDVTMVRIVYAFATFFTAFSGIIVYIILCIVMPEKRYHDGYKDRMNDRLHNQ
ncbi:PspC domain-containing protein [Phocaeicola sp.]|uniref:PspC domain-containing protein n=1 Tax=Phocaeicola sp. TaxID=2773926 RepID=UPI0023C7A616|nr:PspC domain-containing protein [Phocaeicola sp.]MDE5677622.1 PspC domain-containing protein [Phocaeicola sp.]